MTVPSGPGGMTPGDWAINASGAIPNMPGRTQTAVENTLKTQVKNSPSWSGASTTFFSAILGGFFGGIGEFITHIVSAITQGTFFDLGGLSAWMGGLRGDVNGHAVDLAELQDKTQKLEGVIGYCHTYSLGGSSNAIAGDIRIPIDRQIGPIVGATIANGAIYLSSKGLWVADAQLSAEGYTALGSTYMNIQIRVYAPNGTLHAQRIAEADTTSRESLVVHVPFTVPSAGYYVELWGNAAFGRGSRGGSVWNGMSVEKRSTETS